MTILPRVFRNLDRTFEKRDLSFKSRALFENLLCVMPKSMKEVPLQRKIIVKFSIDASAVKVLEQ